MATQTDHMKLTKPAYTDSADIAVINSNMDAIDTATSKILPVISGTTNNSGYTIASGEYFEANGKLYKATASIPTNQAWSSSATEQSDHGAINALNGNLTNSLSNSQNGLCVLKYETHTVSDLPSAYSDGITFIGVGGTTDFPFNYSMVVTFKLNIIGRIVQMNVKYTGEAKLRSADLNTWSDWRTLA